MEILSKIFLLCGLPLAVICTSDYYWRDWSGVIPSDAYVAGNDSRGKAFIAQAYVYGQGLYIGRIFDNDKYIVVNPSLTTGPVAQSTILKVLCSKSDTLLWLPSNKTTTAAIVKYILPVVGGVTSTNDTVYVGRYVTGDNCYIGSVHSDFYVYYTYPSETGGDSDSYEILIREL